MITYKHGCIRGHIKVQANQFPVRIAAGSVDAYMPKDGGVAFYLSGQEDPYVLEGTIIGADVAMTMFWNDGEDKEETKDDGSTDRS